MSNKKRGRGEEEGKRKDFVEQEEERRIDEEVEEFFAIIRRMRTVAKLMKKNTNSCTVNNNNVQNPSFQREDFVALCELDSVSAAKEDKATPSTTSERSSTVSNGEAETQELVELRLRSRKQPERIEENSIPAWLDLTLGFANQQCPCRVVDRGNKNV